MSADLQRWGVVATVDEPKDLILAFVAHYLSLGASRIFIFLDKPAPEIEEILSATDHCQVFTCTENYWQISHGIERPSRHPRRQVLNANLIYKTCDLDWLLHCDADEFLISTGDISTKLSALPSSVGCVQTPNSERAYLGAVPDNSIFEGVFRNRPKEHRNDPSLFGVSAAYTKDGFGGYTGSKTFVRTGLGCQVGIHHPKPMPQTDPKWALETKLLHFDGLTPLHWAEKLAKKTKGIAIKKRTELGAGRLEQIKFVRRNRRSFDRIMQLHNIIQVVDPALEPELRSRGMLDYTTFDPAPAIKRHFPSVAFDLSPQHFDDMLRQHDAQIFELFNFS
ncbi:glycosyltransferase family 2 protein [Actibacterium lipolyticum]|uniref:Glycosyl transferase family 2 n=1 Tax=Actibacterium lipolyticum TaxID=1524263 RepID=A0A238JMZ3_9RHOB|nr:glycosyltransferase family 2 protein [Actibacterium lipolyticum]SMX31136.1 hypothetical protein COL8621_00296 [Actibacterium lipolyticum]